MVVTDSFHGTVFSILFGKDFYSLSNPHRGNTRIEGLLKQLGLEKRLVSNTEPEEPDDREINWESAYARLNELRKSSMDFLEDNLK